MHAHDKKGSDIFRIQILHRETGFYFNTNHESPDLNALIALLQDDAFAGPKFRIVDEDRNIHYGPVVRERSTAMNIEDLAKSFGVPVKDSLQIPPETQDNN